MRQEEALRRIGFILIIFVMIAQIFAIMSPSKSSLATSTGDIIYGASSRQEVLQAYRNNRDKLGRNDIQAIFDYYGIGETQIANAKSVTIKDGDGREYINTSRTTTKFPDNFVKISGATDGGIYEFPLEYWRKGEYPNGYPALTGMSTYGFRFWILLKGCGNIVYEKGAKKPDLDIVKKRTSSSTALPGDTVTYSIEFRNKGIANAKNVSIADRLPGEYSYQSYKSSADLKLTQNGQLLTWKIDNDGSVLAPATRWHKITVVLKAKSINAKSKRVCNSVTIDASNASAATSGNSEAERCVTIDKPLCPGTGLPVPSGGVDQCTITCPDGSTQPYDKTCNVPQLICQQLKTVSEPAWNARKYETSLLMQKGAVAKQVTYFVNDKKVATISVSPGSTTQYFTYTFPTAGEYKVRAELDASKGNVQQGQGCSLMETITKPAEPVVRISTDKSVTNLTQNISDANNTTAHAGDVLRYTLTVENSGDIAANNFAMSGEYSESIADIMEYADLTDKGDAIYNETTHSLSWSPTTIAAGGKIQKQFSVTIKNPIPATPISASNPLSYDYILHNKYGRDINVKLDKPANKIIEQTATALPETGPGASMFMTAGLAVIIGFFFYRSRLLSRELEIVHQEFSAGGL